MTDEMKDAVALLLSRNVAGDCEEAGRVLSVQDIARLPISWTSDISTLIPIVSKEEARKDRPNYFLILPHHFLEEIRRDERKYLESGGRFIVPLPKFRVIP